MRLTRKCLRALGVSGVDDLSKFGLDAPIGPQSDGWPSQDRVTICQMEPDPHPVLRRIFQAGGRERRDVIRNSARCNRDEVGGPPENAMRLGLVSRTSVPAPGRSVGANSKRPSTPQARLLDSRANQGP